MFRGIGRRKEGCRVWNRDAVWRKRKCGQKEDGKRREKVVKIKD